MPSRKRSPSAARCTASPACPRRPPASSRPRTRSATSGTCGTRRRSSATPTTACRKTINLPNDATEEDVAQRLPAGLGARLPRHHGVPRRLQGRAGAQHRRRQGEGAGGRSRRSGPRSIKPRPHSLSGRTYRMETPIGTAFITVNETDDGEPFEVFVQVGKGGSDTMAVAEALGRLISLTLRLPSPLSPQRRLEEVISQLSRIGGAQPLGFGTGKVLSLPDALARTLAEHTGQLKPLSEGPPMARTVEQRRSAISARSAARRRSSTRKAARSACPAASTSADPTPPPHPGRPRRPPARPPPRPPRRR